MVHIFQPKLINNPYNDPGLYINLFGKSYTYLVDAGDISKLSNKDVLKINKLFITHTHMDHFYGFDRIIRTFLGKPKLLEIYGPKGIIRNVNGKLQGYTWNLVENYSTNFTIKVYEILKTKINIARFQCKRKFRLETMKEKNFKNNIISVEDDHKIKSVVLDHKTPCLAFIFEENFHINILKNNLKKYNLETGKWLNILKNKIYSDNLDENIEVNNKIFKVAELKENITKITPGHKIVYITDIIFSKKNIESLKKIISDTTFLFIEAAFLNKEKKRAKERYHLTAKQAGYIAKLSNAKKVIPFHISPIHIKEFQKIKKELHSF